MGKGSNREWSRDLRTELSALMLRIGQYSEELAILIFVLLAIVRLGFPELLNNLPEFPKVFLSFVAIIIFPGFLISGWVASLRKLLVRRLIFSFVFGYAIWTVPSSILMSMKASWNSFYVVYFLVNLLLIAITIYLRRFRPEPFTGYDQEDRISSDWKKPSTIVLFTLLLVAFIPVVKIASTDYMSGDLLSFVATIRGTIRDTHFSLSESIFGTGYPAPLRMVINPWGLVPAFMVKVSDVDPIYLFSRNLPPMFVILAIFSIYLLVKEFNGSRDLALFTALFTVILFLADPYPRLFSPSLDMLRRITADKFFTLYIMMPAGLALARRFFVYGHKHSLLLGTFVGLGIGLTHPLIDLFFTISTATFVAASYIFIKRYRNRAIFMRAVALAIMCVVVLVVPILQQLQYEEEAAQLYVDDFSVMPLEPSTSQITPYLAVHSMGIPGSRFPKVEPTDPGQPNPLTVGRLYSQIAGKKLLVLNTDQYITHPDLIINWPSLLAIAVTPLLFFWTRKDDQAVLMMATTIVYLFLSFNPIITPLIGRFITPWMVYRLTWPILVHFTLAYVLYRFVRLLALWLNKYRSKIFQTATRLLPVVALLVMAFILRTYIEEFYQRLTNLGNPVDKFSDELVDYMQANIDAQDATILSDLETNPLISSVMYRTYVVAHRYNTTNETFPADKQDEAIQRLYDVDKFADARLVDDWMMGVLKTYGVDYILLPIDSALTCQLPHLVNLFQLLYEDEDYQLYRVKDISVDDPIVRANSELMANNYTQAEAGYKNAIQGGTDTVAAYLGLSESLRVQGLYPEAVQITETALAQYPQDICVNRTLGNLYVAVGRKVKAAERYQALASLGSDDYQDYKTLGDLYWLIKQPDEAEHAYQQASAIRFGEQTKEYYQYLYGIYLRLGEEDRAHQYINAAIELEPSADTYLIAGYAAAASGSTEEAAILIDKALRADHDQDYMIAAYAALGNLYLQEEKYDAAIAAYQDGITQGYYKMDWGTDFYLSIGNVYRTMGDSEKALELYRWLTRYDPASSGPYLAIGQIYHDEGDLPAALAEYQKATFAEPFDVMSYLQAAAIYQQVGMDEQMTSMYQRALDIDPFLDKVWILYANRLMGENSVEEAKQAYQRALELNAFNSAIYVGLGKVASAEERWAEAMAAFYLAILQSPASSQGYVALGDILGEIAKLNEAVDAYTQAIEVDPENSGAYARLSNTYRLLGDVNKAIEVDEAALNVSPDSIEALLSLANTYYTQKRYDQATEIYYRVLELDPKQVRPYLSLAKIALAQNNDQGTALEMYKAAVNADPYDWLAITSLGDFYMMRGQLDLAEQVYRTILELPETTAATYLAISNIQQMWGDWDEALHTLLIALEEVKDPDEAYRNLAVFFIGRGDLNEALDAYLKAIQIDPANAQHYAGLAGLAIKLGDLELANQILLQGIKKAEDQSVIHTARAVYFETIGDFDQAEQEFLSASQPPVISSLPYQNLAQFYRDAERFQEAISIYQQALREFPYNMKLMVDMGQTYAAMGRNDDAISWFQVAASTDKSDPSPYLALSNLYLSLDRIPDAEIAAQQALIIRPASAEAHLMLARVYNALKLPEQARWGYEQACRLDKRNSDCMLGLSQLDWQLRDYTQAIVDLQAAIAIQPVKVDLYQSLAQAYQTQGESILAEQILSQAIEKSQDRETALIARAGFFASLGKWDQAEADYQTAFQAYPYSQNAGLQLANFYATRDDIPQALSVLQDLISLPTIGAEAYTALGDLYASKAGWEDAMSAYQQAFSLDPQFSQATLGLSRVLGQLNRAEEALDTLLRGVDAAPQDVDLLLAVGNFHLSKLDYPSAHQAYSQALEIDPSDANALVSMDNLQLIEEGTSEALHSLLQLAEDEPGADIYEMLAAQYQTRGEWHNALYWRHRAVILEPFNGTAWMNLGNQYLALEDLDNAEIALMKAVEYLPASPAALLAFGSLEEAREKDAEAETYYTQAIDAAPGQANGYIALSNLKYKLGETDAAWELLNNCLKHAPASVLAYQMIGQYYYKQGDHEAAVKSYQNGLAVLPGAAELKVDQGNLYLEEYKKAEKELTDAEYYYGGVLERYEKTLLMPDRDWAIEVKADALENLLAARSYLVYTQAEFKRMQPLPESAQAEFQKARAIQPNSITALIGLGKVAEINEQWNEAVQFYQQGLLINPYSAETWNALGQVYLARVRIEEARDAFLNAISISPHDVQASSGIISAAQALSSWGLTQALDNAAYSQHKWEMVIEYIRNLDN